MIMGKNDLQVQLKIPSPSFNAMLDHATSAKPSKTPNKIDYWKTSNTYEYQYDPDWSVEVKKSSFLRCYAYVIDMIEHMDSKIIRLFNGTTHKKSCLFYHDALSLVTAKESLKWMKEKGYEEMCILTEIYLFSRNPVFKHHRSFPPGNIL